MTEKMSHVFITALLQYSLDISARDYKGRSPRDYAETLGEEQYVRCIDDYVLEAIRSGLVDKLEHWALRGYDHISCVLRHDTDDGKRLCEKLKDDRLLKRTGALIASLPKTKVGGLFFFLGVGSLLNSSLHCSCPPKRGVTRLFMLNCRGEFEKHLRLLTLGICQHWTRLQKARLAGHRICVDTVCCIELCSADRVTSSSTSSAATRILLQSRIT